jgi:leucyl-tRNA synthetase
MLRGGGLVAQADWPEPATENTQGDVERRIVAQLRDDVRDIVEVAGIDNPEQIEVVVAPEWKYTAYDIARDADETDALVGKIMGRESMQAVGGQAQEYAAELQDRQRELRPVLGPSEELALLGRASWLLEDEFETEVTVRQAETDEEFAKKAKPGKPAIHIG